MTAIWSQSSRSSSSSISAPAPRCAPWKSACTRMPPAQRASESGKPWQGGALLRLMEFEVRPEWIDYNGHMTDSRYLQVFGDATDALLRYAGVDDAYRNSGRALFTVESHVRHVAEARALEALYVTTQVLELDEKRLRLFHSLHRRRDDALVATAEQLYLHVNGGRAAALDAEVHACLRAGAWRARAVTVAAACRAGRHHYGALRRAQLACPRSSITSSAATRSPSLPAASWPSTASTRQPSCASPARRGTRPEWWRTTSTRSRTSLSRPCASSCVASKSALIRTRAAVNRTCLRC